MKEEINLSLATSTKEIDQLQYQFDKLHQKYDQLIDKTIDYDVIKESNRLLRESNETFENSHDYIVEENDRLRKEIKDLIEFKNLQYETITLLKQNALLQNNKPQLKRV